MKQKRIFAIVIFLIAVLILGIGYAAISDITLTVNGSAQATIDEDNFVVKFDQDTAVIKSDETKVTSATITDDLTATLAVAGLTAKGDKASATYTIKNDSEGLSAELTAEVKTGNNTYFQITPTFDKTTIANGESTTVTIEVELLKTLVTKGQSTNIEVEVHASPVQPTT